MKKLLLLSVITISLFACSNDQSQEQNKTQDKEQGQEIKEVEEKAISIAEVMDMAEQNINKEVYFKGLVKHVCSHSGRRCILIDSTGTLSIRVEAKGDIGGFNRELSGMKIAVKGKIAEKRLTVDFINDWEAKVRAKDKNIEDGGKHCSSELSNISDMRSWMKNHDKDYYSIYYINGKSYEVLD